MATIFRTGSRDSLPLKRDTISGLDRVMVTVVDENGDPVSMGGGGGGTVDQGAAGTDPWLFETDQLPVSLGAKLAAASLSVVLASDHPAITVSGTVTANAGTNLNTSLLALEGGGNLALIAASLSVIDDWDESDRAKVNLIVGQAGVQGGAGASTALTQRVAIATDANAVTLLAGTGTQEVVGDVAEDVPIVANPVTVGGRASAAAPAAVSADGDAVNSWHLRNGAQAVVLTAGGALIGGDAANGLDVDVTRLPALVAGTANIGDVDVLTVPAPLSTAGGGTEATALRVTLANDSTGKLAQLPALLAAGGGLKVEGVAGGVAVTVAGTVGLFADAIEDSAHAPGTLIKVGAVRADGAGTLVDADGDDAPLQVDDRGNLKVAVFAISSTTLDVNIVGAVTLGTIDAASWVEDSAGFDGQRGMFILGQRNDSAATSRTSTDGDLGAFAIDIKGRLFTDGSTVTQPISAASLPLPTGAATQATLASLDGKVVACNTGAVGVTSVPADPFGLNADAASATGSISAKLRFIAVTGIPITGTVTVAAHAVTNAGTFAVQESQVLADNAGFTDGTSKVWPAGFIFDEVAGAALTENDVGAARMDSKRSAVTVLEDATTRGQRAAISATGALKVDGSAVTQPVSLASVPSHAVTNAGTFAVQDSEKIVDNAAFTDGTTKLMPLGAVFDDVAGTALTENDLAAPRIDSKRALMFTLEDATTRGQKATVSAAGALKVDGSAVTQPISVASLPSVAVTNAGTFAVQDSQKIADNGAFTDGTTPLGPVGFIFDEVAGTALTENDIAAPRIDSKRAAVSVIEDATTRGTRAAVATTSPAHNAAALAVRTIDFSLSVSDTFTVVGNGATQTVTRAPVKSYSLQVVQTGTVTAWDVRLEGSVDGGANWTQILQHTNATGSGVLVFSGAVLSPAMAFRARCAGLTLGVGTNVVSTILGME